MADGAVPVCQVRNSLKPSQVLFFNEQQLYFLHVMAKWYDNDDFLLRRLKANDQKAIEFLYRQYQVVLLRTSIRVVGNTEHARDIVQEVFVDFWVKRHRLHISGSVKNYLIRAVYNRSLNFVRDHPVSRNVSLKAINEEEFATAANETSAKLEAKEMKDFLEQQINRLPPQCKTIFMMNRKDAMSYKEIAAALGISVKAVEKQISKAMSIFSKAVQAYLKSFTFLSW